MKRKLEILVDSFARAITSRAGHRRVWASRHWQIMVEISMPGSTRSRLRYDLPGIDIAAWARFSRPNADFS